MSQHIHIASDHAGLALKDTIKAHLEKQGFTVQDHGTHNTESCDYPVFAQSLCQALINKEQEKGILICGTGVGMSIMANRYAHIRAALCGNEFQARATRQHNNANVLCLGERVTGPGLAISMVDIFLTTPFEGGRHQRRIDMFEQPVG